MRVCAHEPVSRLCQVPNACPGGVDLFQAGSTEVLARCCLTNLTRRKRQTGFVVLTSFGLYFPQGKGESTQCSCPSSSDDKSQGAAKQQVFPMLISV